MASVAKDGKYGFINIYREEAVPCIYESTQGFKNGIAWIFKDGKEAYIDTNGNIGTAINHSAFSDTSDTTIPAANALGIVNGIGNNKFCPNGTITRQEAAIMLQMTAKVLGVTTPNGTAVKFSDASKFPDWAAESISFISAMIDKTTNKRVMGGTGNNQFSNLDTYTREQSYLTILRLYNAIR